MSDQFIGEIRAVAFSYPPYGWAVCDGTIMGITQNSALFAVIGTTYGGNGTTTFALPNLMGNAAMHWGSPPGLTPTVIGQVQGSDTVTLTESNLPVHTHVLQGGTAVGSTGQLTGTPSPTALLSLSNPQLAYAPTATPPVPFSPLAITHTGGGQPHNNVQPRLALLYCIALQGIFPARN